MPELPEVEAIRRHLDKHCPGRSFAGLYLTAFSALKTYHPPLEALAGLDIEAALRRGKFLALQAQGLYLVTHLARAGWLAWKPEMPSKPPRPSKGPLSLRVILDDGSGFDLTEAGTQRKLAIWVVAQLEDVPGIATLGPDPLSEQFTQASLDAILAKAGKAQLKGVLRDQRVLAGIGNAYSDEILHAARLSPFKAADSLDDEQRRVLFAAIHTELGDAVARADRLQITQLKGDKKTHMRVHGRTGEECEECGATIAEVSFADSLLQYCPGCQTGGKVLADRRRSKFLK